MDYIKYFTGCIILAGTVFIFITLSNVSKITPFKQHFLLNNANFDTVHAFSTTYDFGHQQNLKPVKDSKYSICCLHTGRLGNMMFQFASTFGIAARKRMSFFLERKTMIATVFQVEDVYLRNNVTVCNTYPVRTEKFGSSFDPDLINFKNDSNIRLGVYLQSWKYFFHSVDSLRKQFVFRKYLRDKVKRIIDLILSKHEIKFRSDVTLVGTHVRRGDLVDNEYGYAVATKEYMKKAIGYYKSKNFTNLIFIVCSDDLTWVKANMPSDVTTEYMAGNSAEIDLAILGSCNHSISTVGSFSWWSAWLANGETTYYKWPAKEDSRLRTQYSKTYSDYFYPGWVGL